MTNKKRKGRSRSVSRKGIRAGAKVQEKKAASNLLAQGFTVLGVTGVSNVDAEGYLKIIVPKDMAFESMPANRSVPALVKTAMMQVESAGGNRHDLRIGYIHLYKRPASKDLVFCRGSSDLMKMNKIGVFTGIETKTTAIPPDSLYNIESPLYFPSQDIYIWPLGMMVEE